MVTDDHEGCLAIDSLLLFRKPSHLTDIMINHGLADTVIGNNNINDR